MTKQAFRFELAPNRGQAVRCAQHAGLRRFVYNLLLAEVKDALERRQDDDTVEVPWNQAALERVWMARRDEAAPWFSDEKLSSRVPKQAARDLAAALSNFSKSRKGARKGRRVGFPTFRSRHNANHHRFRYDSHRARFINNRRIRLPAIGDVKVKDAPARVQTFLDLLDQGGQVCSATVSRVADRWFISFTVDIDRAPWAHRQAPDDAPTCGIDLGLTAFATIVNDDGTVEQIDAPKVLRAAQQKVARLQRDVSRKKKGSSNRRNAVRKLARAHYRVACQRREFLHQITSRLARTKKTIVIEDLNVAGMLRNHSLARAIADVGWGEFVRQLTYKCEWYGTELVVADRFFPSSKTCSECGNIDRDQTLADRVYACGCGLVEDRDVNAARNLLKLAAASSVEALNVCGEDVSLVAA